MALFDGLIIGRKDKIVFLVGCFATFYVNLVGRVYVGELIIFALYLMRRETFMPLPKELKILVRFMALWLISAIVTDWIRDTPLIDMIKGTVSILFLMSLVPFVYWALYDRLSRWMVFYLGTVVSSQLTYYLITSQTEFGSTEIWKTYSYAPLIIGTSIFLYWKNQRYLSYIIFLGFGLWILHGGSRNVFLTCSITVVILFVTNKMSDQPLTERFENYQHRIGGLIIALMIGLVVVDNVYEHLASTGQLGEEAFLKYNKQKNSELGLAIGRIEAIIDAELISKSPIIGYGSFAKDKDNYVMSFYLRNNIPIPPGAFEAEVNSVENMLPRHSRIGGLWMWHGIGAGIFWIYTLWLIIRVLKTGCFLLEPKLMALSVFTMMTEIWNTFFSIMSTRLPLLFMWVYLIILYDRYKVIRDRSSDECDEFENNDEFENCYEYKYAK